MMYEAFYGLDEKPFSVPPDPTFLYLSNKHRKALARLQYSVLNQASFTVISGDIGSGKTTIARELMRQLDDQACIGFVSNVNFSSFEELMQWILYAFELDYDGKSKVGLFETFTDFVINNYRDGQTTVLIIDEAQNLQPDVLEQLRMLSNINVGPHQVLQLILVGQPSLLDTLKRPGLEQFAQRIEVEFFLEPLSLAETKEYIKYRLKVAGGSEDLFLPDTYPLIWRATSGIPRLINVLCGMALVYGFAEQKAFIDGVIIKEVLHDKEGGFSPLGSNVPMPELNAQDRGFNSIGLRPVPTSDTSKQKSVDSDRKDLSTIEKLFLKNSE